MSPPTGQTHPYTRPSWYKRIRNVKTFLTFFPTLSLLWSITPTSVYNRAWQFNSQWVWGTFLIKMQHFKVIILFKLLLTFRSPCHGGIKLLPLAIFSWIYYSGPFSTLSAGGFTRGSITLRFNMGAHSNSWSMLSSSVHPSKNTAIAVFSRANQIFDYIFLRNPLFTCH